MAWTWTRPATESSVGQLATYVSDALARLSQMVKCYERIGVLTYGTTVQVGGNLSRVQLITVTDASNFTVANPTSPREGAEIVLDVFNNTAGAIGVVTMGSEYELAGAFTNPGAGKHRLYAFYRTNTAKWRELYRSAADI